MVLLLCYVVIVVLYEDKGGVDNYIVMMMWRVLLTIVLNFELQDSVWRSNLERNFCLINKYVHRHILGERVKKVSACGYHFLTSFGYPWKEIN